MTLRRFETKPPGGFGFYEFGTEEERKPARDAADEIAETAMAQAERLARAQDLQAAEVLWVTAQRLLEQSRELLMDEPAWPDPD